MPAPETEPPPAVSRSTSRGGPGPAWPVAGPPMAEPEPEVAERRPPRGLVRSASLAVVATAAALVALELLPSRGALVLSAWILALAALALQAIVATARGPAPGQDGAGRSATAWRREHVPAVPTGTRLRRALARLRRQPPRPAPVPFAAEARLLSLVRETGDPGPHLQLHRLLERLHASLHDPARGATPGGAPAVSSGGAPGLRSAPAGPPPAARDHAAAGSGSRGRSPSVAARGEPARQAALVTARTWWEAVPHRRDAGALDPLELATLDALLDLLEAGALGPDGPAAATAVPSVSAATEARGPAWSR